jgi:hypothetical protein
MDHVYERWVKLVLSEDASSPDGPLPGVVVARRPNGPRDGGSADRRGSGLMWHESVLLSAPWVAATEQGAEAYVWRFKTAAQAARAAELMSSGAAAPDCERWGAGSDALRSLSRAVVAACATREDDCASLTEPAVVSPAASDAPDGIEAVVLYAGEPGGYFVALVRSPALRRGGCGSCRRCLAPAA